MWVSSLCFNPKSLTSFNYKETTIKLDQISHMVVDNCNPSPVRLRQEDKELRTVITYCIPESMEGMSSVNKEIFEEKVHQPIIF